MHNKHTQRGSYRTSTLQLTKQKAHEDYQYWGLRSVAEGSTRHNNDNIGTGSITPHMRTFDGAAEGSSLRHVNRSPKWKQLNGCGPLCTRICYWGLYLNTHMQTWCTEEGRPARTTSLWDWRVHTMSIHKHYTREALPHRMPLVSQPWVMQKSSASTYHNR